MAPEDRERKRQLRRVAQWRERVANAERALAVARAGRDDAIRDAVACGVTERAAADAAGCSPAHAHTAAKHGRAAALARRLSAKK